MLAAAYSEIPSILREIPTAFWLALPITVAFGFACNAILWRLLRAYASVPLSDGRRWSQ